MMSTPRFGPTRRSDSVRSWLALSETVLGNASDRLDAINIFPVADGDTGSNMYQTVRAAREAVDHGGDLTGEEQDLGDVLAVAGRAALDQARGNSGTLLAVMLTAMSGAFAGHDRLTAPVLAVALDRARTAAWAALSDPQEGTMLTVLSAAARAAADQLAEIQHLQPDRIASRAVLAPCLDAVVQSAWNAVEQTEDQLQPLHDAAVVDSGGMGLLLVLDALRSTVLGTRLDPNLLDGLHGFSADVPHLHEEIEGIPGFELMCSISLEPLTAATLRFGLNDLGDSVIMSPLSHEPDATGAVRWRLHAHVEDPDAAMELLHQAGQPENLVLERLDGHDEDLCAAPENAQGGTSG